MLATQTTVSSSEVRTAHHCLSLGHRIAGILAMPAVETRAADERLGLSVTGSRAITAATAVLRATARSAVLTPEASKAATLTTGSHHPTSTIETQTADESLGVGITRSHAVTGTSAGLSTPTTKATTVGTISNHAMPAVETRATDKRLGLGIPRLHLAPTATLLVRTPETVEASTRSAVLTRLLIWNVISARHTMLLPLPALRLARVHAEGVALARAVIGDAIRTMVGRRTARLAILAFATVLLHPRLTVPVLGPSGLIPDAVDVRHFVARPVARRGVAGAEVEGFAGAGRDVLVPIRAAGEEHAGAHVGGLGGVARRGEGSQGEREERLEMHVDCCCFFGCVRYGLWVWVSGKVCLEEGGGKIGQGRTA